MTKFLPLFLALFLAACPQLCRAESSGCCADDREESSSPLGDPRTPRPAQNELSSCICAGAIRDSGPQIDLKAGLADWSAEVVPPAGLLVAPAFLAPVARGGVVSERPTYGALRVHLLLEKLRC